MSTNVLLLSIDLVKLLPDSYGEKHFPKRMVKANRFRGEDDRLRCIGAGVLLHGFLGIKEDELSVNEHGKPEAIGKNVSFNLSHSGEYAVLATDEGEVGVDIELMDKSHTELAEHIFSQEEQEWMREDPLKRFYRIWTLKESVMKQCGQGLALSPRSFEVMPLIQGDSITVKGRVLYSVTKYIDEYCISVSAEHTIDRLDVKVITRDELFEVTSRILS